MANPSVSERERNNGCIKIKLLPGGLALLPLGTFLQFLSPVQQAQWGVPEPLSAPFPKKRHLGVILPPLKGCMWRDITARLSWACPWTSYNH